jgi:hypothetical protein
MRQRTLGALVAIVGMLVRCGSDPCPLPSEAPCVSSIASFVSPCGFQSFTTTCTPKAECTTNASECAIPITSAQTCDVTIVLGDGTPHSAHLVITQPPPMDAGRCPMTCPQPPHLDLTVDGVDRTGVIDFSSATCAAPDGGSDASADVTSE